MFEDRTQENIKAETLALVEEGTGLSTQSGSYADATVGAVAGQVSELYKALPGVVSMLFVDETSGGFLDLVGETYFDLTRRPGTRAQCAVTLTGDPGTLVPDGTAFLTATGLEFDLLEAVTIPEGGTAQGTLEAAKEGAAYNIGPDSLTGMYVNLPGLVSYGNQQAAGGTDPESDEALYQRIRERRQKPVNGANGWQYRAWAMEVAGVGEAKVVELAQGPGTVGVTVVDSNLAPAAPQLVESVQEALAAQRPVGAAVTVQAPEKLEISLSAQVILSPATTAETVEGEMKKRLGDYLATLVEEKYGTVYYSPQEDAPYTVIYNRILALLLTIDGVVNAQSLTVSGGSVDVTVQAGQVPTVGTVEVTADG